MISQITMLIADVGYSERSCNTSMCMVVAKTTVIKEEMTRTHVADNVHGIHTFSSDLLHRSVILRVQIN